MNWRRIIGFDPAVKNGGVVSYRLRRGGELRIDPEALRRSVNSGTKLSRLMSEFENYSPPNQGGNPLPDKEKKTLHLDDYQPRDTEHPAFRMFWERSFPTPSPMTMEEVDKRYYMGRHEPAAWVHYRNRHPGIRDIALGETLPMRNAMVDLIGFLNEIDQDLHHRRLVAVEIGVTHEPAEPVELERQGWHYRVEALVVPLAVLGTEQDRFDEFQKRLSETQKQG